jgi:hypothetical protein
MMAALDAIARPSEPADARTLAQRRFDTLLALVCGQITPSNWQVHVLTELATLTGENELPADLPGFAPLPAPVAREVASQGQLRRVVVHEQGTLVRVDGRVHRPDLPPEPAPEPAPAAAPDDTNQDRQQSPLHRPEPAAEHGNDEEAEPGEDDLRWYAQHRPLEPDETRSTVGARPVHLRRRWTTEAWQRALHRIATDPLDPTPLRSDCYVPPPTLKRHLERRDKTCIFPGCPRRAELCDKDHLIPYPRGATCETNLAAECDHHHHAKHEYFTVQRLPDGTFRWHSPTGLHTDRSPQPVLDAWTYKPR